MTKHPLQYDTCVVLLIEDNPSNTYSTLHALSQARHPSFQVECFDQLADAVGRLGQGGVDVVLVDFSLPQSRRIETLQVIRANYPHVPIVAVTGLDDESLALEMLNEGIQDYLLKDELAPALLARSLRFAIERQRVKTLESLNQQLKDTQVLLSKKTRRLAKLYRTAHEFVENVSHEFRTPLTVIKEYASLVKDGVVGSITPEQRHMLSVVEDRADDLNTMVDDMLDVSNLESGLLGVYRKNCQVEEIIARVRPCLLRKARVKGVHLTFEAAADLPTVFCDPEKAGRVLINLVTNAIKFCGQPGRVQLSCHRDPDRAGLKVCVSDNGRGISPENQEVIFQRFKQLSDAASARTKGFGLGLNIARELVELNLGRIQLESRVGSGSTFSFTLPPADPLEVFARYLERVEHVRNRSSHLSLVRAEIDERVSRTMADDADAFLNYLLRGTDLLFRPAPTRWLVVLPIPETELPAFHARVTKGIGEANRNRPGDPLADIRLAFVGAWRVKSARENLLAGLRTALQCESPAYA